MRAVSALDHVVSPRVLPQIGCIYLPLDTLPRPLGSRVITLLI